MKLINLLKLYFDNYSYAINGILVMLIKLLKVLLAAKN
jgi:hypothetical protein